MISYLPDIITRPLANGADLVKSTLGGLSWGPVVTISRTMVTGMFAKLDRGTLVVKDMITGQTDTYGEHLPSEMTKFPNGSTNGAATNGAKKIAPGSHPAQKKITLTIFKDSFWVRVLLFADMGFAEAYMLGEVDTSDLAGFFQVSHTWPLHSKC